MTSYSVTFLMPVYNSEAYLKQAIDSLLCQSSPDWKLICIDDESKDSSVQIIEEYITRDDRISLLKQKNSGPGVARARAIEIVTTPFCGILDSDDALDKSFVESIQKRIVETGADVIVPEAQFITEDGELRHKYLQVIPIPLNSIFQGGEEAFSMTIPWKLHGWQVMSTELAKKYYTIDALSYSRFNSDEYITRVIYLKCRMAAVSDAIYIHRINGESITQKVSLKRMDYLKTFYKLRELISREHLSCRIEETLYQEFLIEIVTLWQMSKRLNFEESNSAKNIIKDYYYKFKDSFYGGIIKGASFKNKVKLRFAMLGFWTIPFMAWCRNIRQK